MFIFFFFKAKTETNMEAVSGLKESKVKEKKQKFIFARGLEGEIEIRKMNCY